LAVALVLWKDFKSGGRMDVDVMRTALQFAENLGVTDEFNAALSTLPPMRVEVRYP